MPKIVAKSTKKRKKRSTPLSFVESCDLKALEARLRRSEQLFAYMLPIPVEFVSEAANGLKSDDTEADFDRARLGPTHCDNYKELVKVWRKAMKWSEGLDVVLSCMLSSAISTMTMGDQLWFFVVAPPSSGKTTLCEALTVSNRYVRSLSTFRGFHSGMRGEDGENLSLIEEVNGKTFIIKDGDTLLQLPDRNRVLSEFRDIYDGSSRSHYRNGAGQDWNGIRMTCIIAGTNSLREIDQSELGARFLTVVMMEEIEDEFEDDVLWRIANRANLNMSLEVGGDPDTHQDKYMTDAMQMTAGYLEYLRINASKLLHSVEFDEEDMYQVTRMAKFVAIMRARPSKIQAEDVSREFAGRLVSQHVRLAKHMAVVLNRKKVDTEVLRRVRKVAMDTSRGITLKIADHLYKNHSEGGCTMKNIEISLKAQPSLVRTMVKFLEQLNVIERNYEKIGGVKSKQNMFRLTNRMKKLYEEVHG